MPSQTNTATEPVTLVPAETNGAAALSNPFESVGLDTLPVATRMRSDADAKLATMLHAAMSDGKAAREGTVHDDRAAAGKRASQLKRLATGAPELPTGKTAGTRIITVPSGGYQVAVFLADKRERKAKDDAPATA